MNKINKLQANKREMFPDEMSLYQLISDAI